MLNGIHNKITDGLIIQMQVEFAAFTITQYFTFNLALTLLILSWLSYLFFRQRWMWTKPSLVVLFTYHIFTQWPLVFMSNELEAWWPYPWEGALLIHLFIFLGLVWCSVTNRRVSRAIWGRVIEEVRAMKLNTPAASISTLHARAVLNWLVALEIVLAAVYLFFVPISETGLYVLLTNTSEAVDAREASLKLLENPIPQYALSIIAGTIAPLITALVLFLFGRGDDKPYKLYLVGALCLSLLLASLSGAKGILVHLILVGVMYLMWSRALAIRATTFFFALSLALLPAIVITLMFATVDGTELDADMVLTQTEAILRRVFVIPFVVDTWVVHYEQTAGTIGLAGFTPKLYAMLGGAPVDLSNMIGLEYAPAFYGHEVAESTSATSGFVFSNYAYLGFYIGSIVNLIFLVLIDLIGLYFMQRIRMNLLIPILAALNIASLKFVQSDFGVVWLTHGFGLILITVWLAGVLTTSFLPYRTGNRFWRL